MGLAKILLFVFNFIFVILGIVLIISGVLIHTSDQSFDVLVVEGTPLPFLSVGTITIVLGVIVFIVAFTGCCGAIKESKFLLTIFIVLLFIILALELAGAVLAYFYNSTVEDTLTESLMKGLKQYNSSATKESDDGRYTQAWDLAQEEFTCCGVSWPSDWSSNGTFSVGNYPDSCCKKMTDGCGTQAVEDAIYKEGCKLSIIAKITGNLILSGTVCVVIIVAQILGILFSCCVLRDIGKGEQA